MRLSRESLFQYSVSLKEEASFQYNRLIGASAGLVGLRGKRAQRFGPHEHTLRLGRDWPVMAIFRQAANMGRAKMAGSHQRLQ